MPIKDDLETLKAWCALVHQIGDDEYTREAASAVMDLISQVGTFRAERDKLKADLKQVLEYYGNYQEWVDYKAHGTDGDGVTHRVDSHFDGDLGKTARNALKKLYSPPKEPDAQNQG